MESKVSVRAELSKTPPVAGDPSQIREALINLILNALEAMPQGGTITLRTKKRGNYALISVSDTGESQEVKERAFDLILLHQKPSAQGAGPVYLPRNHQTPPGNHIHR